MNAPVAARTTLGLARLAGVPRVAFDAAFVIAPRTAVGRNGGRRRVPGRSRPHQPGTRWLVLISLKGGKFTMQRELAEEVGIDGSTLTHYLNRMEADGLINRTRRPDNRRTHHVELTPKGDAMFHQLRHTVVEFDRTLRTGFLDEEIETLRTTLGRLSRNIDDSTIEQAGLQGATCSDSSLPDVP